jgi:hypothetical protein
MSSPDVCGMTIMTVGDFLFRFACKLAAPKERRHNRHFPPSFEVDADHLGLNISRCGHSLRAGWYSALADTRRGACNIVLSGPSVKSIIEPARLGREFSIWVNNSPVLATAAGVRPSLYLVVDPGFVRRNPDPFLANCANADLCISSFICLSHLLRQRQWNGARAFVCDDPRMPLRRSNCGRVATGGSNLLDGGHTVAHAACRAAMLMGFKELRLFGLDLGGQRFYGETKPEPSRIERQFLDICAEMEQLAADARLAGVSIVNCSPNSRLPASIIGKADPNEVLNRECSNPAQTPLAAAVSL